MGQFQSKNINRWLHLRNIKNLSQCDIHNSLIVYMVSSPKTFSTPVLLLFTQFSKPRYLCRFSGQDNTQSSSFRCYTGWQFEVSASEVGDWMSWGAQGVRTRSWSLRVGDWMSWGAQGVRTRSWSLRVGDWMSWGAQGDRTRSWSLRVGD